MRREAKNKLKFATKFLAFLAIFYTIIIIPSVNDHLVVPFTAFLTRLSSALLRGGGADVHAIGTTMASTRFAIDVRNGCNAIETMMLFGAAVLAFPASARSRMIAIATGLPIIQFVNVIRLTSLFWIGSRRPEWFETFHVAIWQIVIILIGVAMFAIWSARSATSSVADRR